MKTSNFARDGKNPNAIAISVGTPRFWKGKRYKALAPTREMLEMDSEGYNAEYTKILAGLDPQKVWAELHGMVGEGEEPILLCWESPNVRCHRRFVAEWFEQALGVTITDAHLQRSECLPYIEQPSKLDAKKSAAKKTTPKSANYLLF